MIGSLSSPSLLSSGLNQATNSQASALNRLGSGSRINSAKDDAAGLAIATQLAAQLSSNSQALRNVYDGLSLTDTASSALGQVSDSLQRMRELAVQSANGTNSPSDRQALQAEFAQLGQNVDKIASQTQFNGQNLLDGGFSTAIQSGPNAGDTQSLSLANASQAGLNLGGIDITSSANAGTALDAIDQAIASVSSQQSSLGAAQAGLNSTASSISGTYEQLAATKSRIADTDFSSETSEFSLSNVKQQAALKALSLYNANQASSTLGLLPKSFG